MLKIIEGKYKRKIIQTPNSLKIRPTSSRMRKSIFDVLSHSKYLNEEIYNTKVLDVFAGSGMMGLECLSRGAIYCKFIDNSNECIKIINKNLSELKLKSLSTVLKLDANYPTPAKEKYGLSFFDPPYSELNFSNILIRWEEKGWFTENAICVYEKRKKTYFELPKKFLIIKNIIKSKTEVLILKKSQ